MRHIDKRFGAVQANRDVHLSVRAGTVHGIVGENGAGKSTLMSILYGFYTADSGSIAIEGKATKITGSREAIALGIGNGSNCVFMLFQIFRRFGKRGGKPQISSFIA